MVSAETVEYQIRPGFDEKFKRQEIEQTIRAGEVKFKRFQYRILIERIQRGSELAEAVFRLFLSFSNEF